MVCIKEDFNKDERGKSKWRTRQLFAKTATRLLFSPKASKLSIRKRDLKTSHRGALIAGRRVKRHGDQAGTMTGRIAKCFRQYVPHAANKRPFLSGQPAKNRFTAKIVIRHVTGRSQALVI
jgi:hypothetical protein